jgi:hypothetical protein
MNAAVPESMCSMEIKQHTRMLQHPPKKKNRTGGDHWGSVTVPGCAHAWCLLTSLLDTSSTVVTSCKTSSMNTLSTSKRDSC